MLLSRPSGGRRQGRVILFGLTGEVSVIGTRCAYFCYVNGMAEIGHGQACGLSREGLLMRPKLDSF